MAVADRLRPHAILEGPQRAASDPEAHVWLSASAGTGKTYVLSARVLRLLLRGVSPDAILCLTFTKAGAAEMAERVHQRLAHWVQIEDTLLHHELEALGEVSGPGERDFARTLFAKVLESRGGGLRIMTIHAFCQTLLAGFPLEAGLLPGFRPLEGREQAALIGEVLTNLVIQAEREGDARLSGDLQALSLRLGEDAVIQFLMRAAPALEGLEQIATGLEAIVRRALDVPAEFSPADTIAACTDGAFERGSFDELAAMLNDWGSSRAVTRLGQLGDWLIAQPEDRARTLAILRRCWAKSDGDLFESKGWVPPDPAYFSVVARLDHWCSDLLAQQGRAELAATITAALNAATRYARAYAEAKRIRGLVDFDDMIQRTRALLDTVGMGEWIRYKLDQATDHVLVDESQDTNADQWAIVRALTSEYFAGEGAKPETLRTVFTVGDYKQAIFGFQGTDPQFYEAARYLFTRNAQDVGQDMLELSLQHSFRSSPPVLDVVDAVLSEVGGDALGLGDALDVHRSAAGGTGSVLLLPPVTAQDDLESDAEEEWLPEATRILAGKLAKQVRAWLDEGLWLAKHDRALMPGDVMILVRKRGDLASLLVARLHEEGVPVAGVDRLRLQAPLAVQDLVSAMRFAAQPQDDLNLAALLVSPLIGWSQEALFDVAYDRPGALWEAIPEGDARTQLLTMLSAADNITPYAFLEQLLSGQFTGRKALLARLGNEARDPINELLNAALQFERDGVTSLQGFLDAFDRNEADIVRDPGASGDAVRVMTVHGAKGLQAPLVILADACGDPENAKDPNFKWAIEGVAEALPLFRPRTAERLLVASLEQSAADADLRARQEHWRLLYVAMTRAEERLVIAGSLGPAAARKGVPEQSWHAVIERAMMRMTTDKSDDARWGSVMRHGDTANVVRLPAAARGTQVQKVGPKTRERPDWLDRPAPHEARPPRPLAPSSIGADETPNPPPGAALLAAAERGRLLHALFQRLPTLSRNTRRAAAEAWVAAAGGDQTLVDHVLQVIDDPEFAMLFASDALAEAPVAGVVDGIVIAGTIDRMAVTDTVVEIVDFKTGRRVPETQDAIPVQHVRQMAAYAALLAGVFPDHEIRASLLYSEGPVLHRLPPSLLAAHKPGLVAAKDNYVTTG
jgi:ATP-dependent helicase/nuclease subunit A